MSPEIYHITLPVQIFLLISLLLLFSRRYHSPFNHYFFLGSSLKLLGGFCLGLIYFHYYQRGDTIEYFKHANYINSYFLNDPIEWMKIFTGLGELKYETKQGLITHMGRWLYSDSELLLIKITSIFGLISFNSYYGISILFSLFSFWGLWNAFLTITKVYPNLHQLFFISFFLIPSLVFWGSGLLKDSVAIGLLEFAFTVFYKLLVERKKVLLNLLLLFLILKLMITLRSFMLIAVVPPMIFWTFRENQRRIKHSLIRKYIAPFFVYSITIIILIGVSYYLREDPKYSIEQFGKRVKISAEYLYNLSKNYGSVYYLGKLDGTFWGTIKLAPQAIWISLFRPYIWEANNMVMLLSAVESMGFLVFTAYCILVSYRRTIKVIKLSPLVQFGLIFTFIFAFAIGISTYNFGSLVRYKISFIPFYLVALFIILHWNKIQQFKNSGSHIRIYK